MSDAGFAMFEKHLTRYAKRRSKKVAYDYSANATARTSFSGFQKRIARGRGNAEFATEPIAIAQERMIEWCFERGKHIAIGAPPGIFKSYTARNFLCWRLGVNPLTRTIITSLNLSISSGAVSSCRNMVGRQRFCRVFPDVELDTDRNRKAKEEAKKEAGASQGNRQEKFYLLNSAGDPDAAMEAVAFYTPALNRRVDVGLFDDIESGETVRSLATREKTYKTLMDKWVNGRLIHPQGKGVAIVLSNCWHEDDIIHRLQKSPEFASMWVFVTEDLSEFEIQLFNCPDDNPLAESCRDPERAFGLRRIGPSMFRCPFPSESEIYSVEGLREKQASTPNFDSIFRFIAMADEDRMFSSWGARKRFDGDIAMAHRTEFLDGFRLSINRQQATRFSFAWGYDIAAAARKGEVLSLWSVDLNGIFRPVYVRFANRITPDDLIETIEAWRQAGVHPVSVRIENNATQQKLVEIIQIETERRGLEWQGLIEAHTTGANKYSADGLPGVEVLIKQGRIEWPIRMATMPGVGEHWTRLETQFQSCPAIPARGETPDGIMSSWFAIKGLQERACFGTESTVEAVTKPRDSSNYDDDAPRARFARF